MRNKNGPCIPMHLNLKTHQLYISFAKLFATEATEIVMPIINENHNVII